MYTHGQKTPSDGKTVLSMLLVGITLLGGLLQVINWDKHAVAVIPLQASVLLGNADAKDYDKFAKICMERKKYDCTMNSLKQLIRLEPSLLEAKLELGLLQFRMKDLKAASETLSSYIEAGGQEQKAKFHLAKAYAGMNNTKDALKIYDQLLNDKKNIFQVSVTREYVQTLIQAEKWAQAKKSIEKARLRSATHNAFMSAEYKLAIKKAGQRNLASH